MAIVRPFVTYSDDYNENVLNKAISAGMTEDEKVLILAFIKHLEAKKRKRPISEGTKRVLISKLCSIRKHTDIPFTKLTGKDLDKLFNDLSDAYAANTLNVLKATFIEFYRYLISNQSNKIKMKLDDLKGIEKSEIPLGLDKKDLLTADDIEKMLAATRNPMHRALIAMLAESGARVHEVCMLKWSDLSFDPQGIVLSVKSTKVKNKIRTVRLRDSVPYISAWKAVYPHYSPSEPVFITARGTTLIYELVRSTVARIARDAGIDKKITPHVFRHSRVTELIRMGMHEPELKKSLWGSVSTKMLERYEHLAAVDVDSEYKRVYGLEDGEKTKPMLSSVQCGNCHTINGKGAQFCMVCGLPLSENARVQVQTTKDKIEDTPEFKAAFEAALAAIKATRK